MITQYDKAITALIVPLILYLISWLATNYGLTVTPEVEAALTTLLFWLLPIITGGLVYLVPNKAK